MSSKSKKLPLHGPKSGPKAQQSKSSYAHWPVLAAAGIIIVAALLAYHNSFGGPFIFDGISSIVENSHIRQLWPIWQVTRAEPGWTVAGRPILSLSFALNYQISGLKVWSYHAVNLAVHILSALTLFGIVRRTLLCEKLRARFGKASFSLSLICALIWLVHPLQTGSVTYIVQRAESLMGLFYLLSLYCAIRGFSSAKSRRWYTPAILACALGMGTKEVMATAPFMVLLYDRVFVSRSFKKVFARRWSLYAGLAATWLIFGVLALTAPRGGTVGFGLQKLTALGYAITQCKVIVSYYLKLSFWPHPLVLDYGRAITRTFGEVAPYAAVLAVLLAATLTALRYRSGWGFLGVWFFIILAPSSSILPIITEVAAEHRMYLPLAAVVVAVVLCGYIMGRALLARLAISDRRRARLGRTLGYVLAGVVIVILGLLTFRRNNDYASDFSIWDVTVRQRPNNPRAFNNRGNVYVGKGKLDKAIADYNQSVRLNPKFAEAYSNRGNAYAGKGALDKAIDNYNQAIWLNPKFAEAYSNRGNAYAGKGELGKAIDDYNQAIRIRPKFAEAYNNLAWLLATHEDARIRDGAKAVRLAERACQLTAYKDPAMLDTLAAAYAEAGQFDRAVETAQRALRLVQKAGKTELAEDVRTRMELYKTKRPYHEPFTSQDRTKQGPKE